MKKVLVAFVGPQAVGKEYLAQAIINSCGGTDRVAHHSTGNYVRQQLIREGKSPEEAGDRANCSAWVKKLTDTHGLDALTRIFENFITTDRRPVQIFDSMRLIPDEQMVMTLSPERFHVIRVYLTAPPEVRFERLGMRKRGNEGKLTPEQFQAQEEILTESAIPKIGERCGPLFTLNCVGTPDELDQQKLDFCHKHLRPYLVL